MDSYIDLNVDDLIEKLIQKVTDLENATIILSNKDFIQDEINDIHLALYYWSQNIDDLRLQLDLMKEQNVQLWELFKLLENVGKKCCYMEERIPPALETIINTIDQQFSQNSIQTDVEDTDTNYAKANVDHKEKKSTVREKVTNSAKESALCKQISPLTPAEFSKIPSYIIGRNTISTVNALINSINEIIKDKYSLIQLGQKKAKNKGHLDRYLNYKREEITIKNSRGSVEHFFTSDDYVKYMKIKLDKTKLNLLTALRHCHRIEFEKIGKELFYIISKV